MNYRAAYEQMKADRQRVVQSLPDIMSNNAKSTKISHQAGTLDEQTKHLISLAMSVIIKCDECILDHVIHLYDLGCSRQALSECLQLTVTLQACPGIKYSQLALEIYDGLAEEDSYKE